MVTHTHRAALKAAMLLLEQLLVDVQGRHTC